jgi:glycosyltransferase involved in cell wall biosynthesis
MIKRNRFLCWQPVLTDHQAYTLAALADAANADIATIAVAHNQPKRVAQGWLPLRVATLSPVILSRSGWIGQVVRLLRYHTDTIHLFCSPFGDIRIILALTAALRAGRRVYVVSEPYSPVAVGYLEDTTSSITKLKAFCRPHLYRLYGFLMRGRVAGVFAISPLAVNQYRAMGIPDHQIFPFGYFVPNLTSPIPWTRCITDFAHGLRLCFVGNLIARKGISKLIDAARMAVGSGRKIIVDIYGPGDPTHYAFDADTVRYRGMIPFGSASAVIAGYDALVVPSEHDGWGVVVNEALMAGIPVIASKNVGASAMVAKAGCGVVYEPGKSKSLAEVLISLANNPEQLITMRDAALRLRPALTPEVAGRYMNDAILGEQPPVCPWYDSP